MLRRDLSRFAVVLAVSGLAACTTQSIDMPTASLAPGAAAVPAASTPTAEVYDDNAPSAGNAFWTCDNGDTIQIENTMTAVSVAMPDGKVMEMPATPADSRTRYVLQQFALIFDGDEALFFRPKASPLTCRKGRPATVKRGPAASIDLKNAS